MSKLVSEMTLQELKALTLKVAAELKSGVNVRRNIRLHQEIKAETLARAAQIIAEGRDTPELLAKVNRLTMGR